MDLIVENLIQIKNGITINASVSVKIQKHCMYKKDYIWNPATYSSRDG